MKIENLDFTQAHFLPPLLRDYLNRDPRLQPLCTAFPDFEALGRQAERKTFSAASRALLLRALRAQYRGFEMRPAVTANLSSLESENTFTLTTGHQLNLFSGPLYVWYKIQTVINLCQALNRRYGDYHFVPVHWMATEDHDFEEINHFLFDGSPIRWDASPGGAVGRLSTASLAPLFAEVSKRFGTTERGAQLTHWFLGAYRDHDNLAAATRYLINEWFGSQGLLVLDGDSKPLKRAFIPHLKAELLQGVAHRALSQSSQTLARWGYKVQAHPRPLNLFYLGDRSRERLLEQGPTFHLSHSGRSFSTPEILETLQADPQRFSPNVLLRPLYQEVVLPNLAYIGGAGELAYWLQLKGLFDARAVPFPILILRNSLLILSQKQRAKLAKLAITPQDFLAPPSQLAAMQTRKYSKLNLSLETEKAQLNQMFARLSALAGKTDPSFLGAVRAQQAKQLKGMEKLEKRLLKAEMLKLRDRHARIEALREALFPRGSLQERSLNFSTFYRAYGDTFTQALKEAIRPLENAFLYLTL